MKYKVQIFLLGQIFAIIGAIILSFKFDYITYVGLCLFWASSILISYIFKTKNWEDVEEQLKEVELK